MDDDSPFAGPPTDDDLTIPRAAMNKLIKELCPNMRVATESRYNHKIAIKGHTWSQCAGLQISHLTNSCISL